MQFKDHNTGNVLFENFPKLLGILGTDIAEDIAKRIFEIFSGNKDHITLNEYLKYIDVYHYGDKNERCNLTCKLMDFNNDGQITFNEFYKYINLIIGAVRKVNPYLKSELFNKEDINILFNKISNNKDYFTYDEFFMIYNEKPEIISWIDYFKNDSDDSLLILHKYIKKIIKIFYNFSKDIIDIFQNYKKNLENEKKNKIDMDKAWALAKNLEQTLIKFEKEIAIQNEKLQNFAQNNQITLRNLFSILLKEEESIPEVNDININNNFINTNKIKTNDENHFFKTMNPVKSVNLFNSNTSDKDVCKNIKEDSKTNNIIIRKSLKMQTIRNFFEDVKKNLKNDSNLNKRALLKSQSICGKNSLFRNKLYNKDINKISHFNFKENDNNNTDNNK